MMFYPNANGQMPAGVTRHSDGERVILNLANDVVADGEIVTDRTTGAQFKIDLNINCGADKCRCAARATWVQSLGELSDFELTAAIAASPNSTTLRDEMTRRVRATGHAMEPLTEQERNDVYEAFGDYRAEGGRQTFTEWAQAWEVRRSNTPGGVLGDPWPDGKQPGFHPATPLPGGYYD